MDCRAINLRLGDAVRTARGDILRVRALSRSGRDVVQVEYEQHGPPWLYENRETLHVLDNERVI